MVSGRTVKADIQLPAVALLEHAPDLVASIGKVCQRENNEKRQSLQEKSMATAAEVVNHSHSRLCFNLRSPVMEVDVMRK